MTSLSELLEGAVHSRSQCVWKVCNGFHMALVSSEPGNRWKPSQPMKRIAGQFAYLSRGWDDQMTNQHGHPLQTAVFQADAETPMLAGFTGADWLRRAKVIRKPGIAFSETRIFNLYGGLGSFSSTNTCTPPTLVSPVCRRLIAVTNMAQGAL